MQGLTSAIESIGFVNDDIAAYRIAVPGTRCDLRYGKKLYLPTLLIMTAVLTPVVVTFTQFVMTTIVFVLVRVLVLMLVPVFVSRLNGETDQHEQTK